MNASVTARRSRRRWTVAFLATWVVVLGAMLPEGGRGLEAERQPLFPAKVVDIEGREIDVTQLARDHNLVVVTLKATWCPVCRRQLERIRDLLPKLERCNVTFVVLAPGPASELATIKKKIDFDFPFVADDNLDIARSLGLDRPGNQIFPCMFEVLENRRIGWKQLGRNGAYFGDGELERYFDCRPV